MVSTLLLLARLVSDLGSPESELEIDAIAVHNIVESLRSPVNNGNTRKWGIWHAVPGVH